MEQHPFLEQGFDFSTASGAELIQFLRDNEVVFAACNNAWHEIAKREEKRNRSMRAKKAAQLRKVIAAQGA